MEKATSDLEQCTLCWAIFDGENPVLELQSHYDVAHATDQFPTVNTQLGTETAGESLRRFTESIRELSSTYWARRPQSLPPAIFRVCASTVGSGHAAGRDLKARASPVGEDSPPRAPPPTPIESVSPVSLVAGNGQVLSGDIYHLVQEGRRMADCVSAAQFQAHAVKHDIRWPTWAIDEVYWGCRVPVENFRRDTETSTIHPDSGSDADDLPSSQMPPPRRPSATVSISDSDA